MGKHYLWISILLILVALVGCKATPDTGVVIDKRTELDLLTSQAPEVNEMDTSNVSDVSWIETFETIDGSSKITVDVVFENNNHLPAVRIKPLKFTEERVRELASILFSGCPVYKDTFIRTKEQIENEIVQMRLKISEIETQLASGNLVKDSDYCYLEQEDGSLLIAKTKEGLTQTYRNRISELEKEYANSSNSLPKIPADYQFIELYGFNQVCLISEKEDNSVMKFNVSENIEAGTSSLEFITEKRYEIGSELADGTENVGISLDEATDIANEVLTSIGLKDMTLKECKTGYEIYDESKKCYIFYYTRDYNSIPQTFIDGYYSTAFQSDDGRMGYCPSVEEELIEIVVDSDGLQRLRWKGASEAQHIVNDNVSTLSIEEIKNIAKKQLGTIFSSFDGSHFNVSIEEAKLGMSMLQQKDSSKEYLVIPVWDFIGNYVQTLHTKEGDTEIIKDESSYSLLTINAIDGSIIDRGVAY